MSGRFFKGVSDSESESSDAESDIVPLRIQAGAAAWVSFSIDHTHFDF